MAGYYDPNKDYSAAIEAEKSKGANADQSVIQQLQAERENKINDKYGGNEPVMYGSNKTYSELSENSGDYITNKANQNTINNAVSVTQSDTHKAAYEAALAGDWDRVGSYINEIGMWTPSKYTDEAGATLYDMTEANAYLRNLNNMFDYDAKEYYDRRYDEVYGAGSAATFDATGGAIKTYAELVDKLGAGKAQEMIAQYSTTPTKSSAVPGLSYAEGMSASGGINDMTKYLKDLFASNLEAELAALKSTFDNNVAELESQNDKIAAQYRAAQNQAAAQNALQVQGMNERALATGLNTGASGQLALAQNMAYQNNLGNLWAQEAQDKAESDRMMAEMMRDYNASVNQATANSNAQLAEALYKEMIRQEEMAAAAEAARIKQEQADREWLYMLEQDELDRQLAYAQLAAKNAPAAPKGMSLSTAKAMAEAGQLTDEVVATLIGEGYNAEFLASEYGYVAPNATPVSTVIPEGLVQSIGMNRTAVGQTEAIKRAVEANQITETQAAELLLKFGLL